MQTMPLVVMLIWFGPYQWYTQFSLYRSSFLSFYLYPAFPIFLNLHVFVFLSLTTIQPLVNISLSLSLFTSLYNFSSIYLCLLCFNLYFLVLSHHLALPSFSLFVLYISFFISIWRILLPNLLSFTESLSLYLSIDLSYFVYL